MHDASAMRTSGKAASWPNRGLAKIADQSLGLDRYALYSRTPAG